MGSKRNARAANLYQTVNYIEIHAASIAANVVV